MNPMILAAFSLAMHEASHEDKVVSAPMLEEVECEIAAPTACMLESVGMHRYADVAGMPLHDISRPAVRELTIEAASFVSREMKVNVDISHGARGDLEVNLYAPDGTRFRLKGPNQADPTDDLNATWIVDVSNESVEGRWRLEIVDHYVDNAGHLNEWSVELSPVRFPGS
ncbi:MAG: proprotein convertase P-domain-containing protein [Myxococcota bacterium]